jgi:hypothetical protein
MGRRGYAAKKRVVFKTTEDDEENSFPDEGKDSTEDARPDSPVAPGGSTV